MRLAVANLKGGVGKTVSAVCLGLLLQEEAPTTLIDTDPQGSALAWSELAQFPFPVVAPPAPHLRDLSRRLPDLASGSTHIVIDTPPGDVGIVRSALSAADTVLIPVKTYGMDLARLTATVDLLAEVEGRHRPDWFVLLTQTRAKHRLGPGGPGLAHRAWPAGAGCGDSVAGGNRHGLRQRGA